jgi:hypothetical protein
MAQKDFAGQKRKKGVPSSFKAVSDPPPQKSENVNKNRNKDSRYSITVPIGM